MQGKSSTESPVRYSRPYRFQNLREPGSRWLVVSIENSYNTIEAESSLSHQPARRAEPNLNEPIPGNDEGHYDTQNPVFRSSRRSSRDKLESLRYDIFNVDERHISVTNPFIPYDHFRDSRAYREGYTYTDYLDMLRMGASWEADLFSTRIDWCTKGFLRRDDLPLWHPPANAYQVSTALSPFQSPQLLRRTPDGLCYRLHNVTQSVQSSAYFTIGANT